MADLTWGAGGDYSFASNAIGNGWEIVSDAAVLPPQWYEVDSDTIHLYKCNQVETIGGYPYTLRDEMGYCHARAYWDPSRWEIAASPFGSGFKSLSNDAACDLAQGYGGTNWPNTGITNTGPRSLEGWFYMAAGTQFGRGIMGTPWCFEIVSPYWPGTRMRSQLWTEINGGPVSYGVLLPGEWQHLAADYDGVDTCWQYVNGVCVGSLSGLGARNWGSDQSSIFFHATALGCIVNNVRVLKRVEHPDGTTFYPHVYEATGGGSLDGVVLVHGLAGAQKLSSVAWTGTFGAGSGSVAAVYVNTGTDLVPTWTQVGGANPTSPITGLDYTVPTRCVKFALAPKADVLQTASPTLATATLGLAPTGGVILPHSRFMSLGLRG